MRLGIDMDGVIYDFDKVARDIYLIHSDVPERITESQRYKLHRPSLSWNGLEDIVGRKNWGWLWQNAKDLKLFERLAPIPGNIEALRELINEHEVYMVTTRPKGVEDQTYRWLGLYNLAPKGVIHASDKGKVAEQLKLQVVADDHVENLKKYLQRTKGLLKGLRVYGIRQPHNSRLDLETSYYRFSWVDSLRDVGDELRVVEAA